MQRSLLPTMIVAVLSFTPPLMTSSSTQQPNPLAPQGSAVIWRDPGTVELIKTWRFITLVLAALLMGMTFCHVLEMPAKMRYDASLYLTLHRTLYVAFGMPNIGAFIELGAILAAGVLTFLVRKRRPAFSLTLLGAVALAAGLGVYFVFIEPANAAMKDMAIGAPPAAWTGWRDQWEYGHAAHFICHLIGFSALALSVILEASTAPASVRGEETSRDLPPAHWQPGS